MTEDKMKSLIQGSLLKTSDGFTEKLIDRLELQKTRRIKVHFLMAFAACFALFFLVTKLTFEINLFHFHLSMAPRAIHFLALLVTFTMLNKLVFLRRDLLAKTG